MRWWGWGEDGHDVTLPPAADELLRGELGLDPAARSEPVALDDVRLPEPALPSGLRERLAGAAGDPESVRDDREARVRHSAGRSYPDLVKLRSGDASRAPDAVVRPTSADRLAPLLEACAGARVAVVPFGGGTSGWGASSR